MEDTIIKRGKGFPGDLVVKNLPGNEGDAGSIPGLNLGLPALQADALPSEPPGKPPAKCLSNWLVSNI